MSKDVAVVILAAGKGTRLKSNLAKVLHTAGGRSLIEHVVHTCRGVGGRGIVVVVGHQAEQVSAVAEPFGSRTVLQQPQRGTGHAVIVARRGIPRSAKFALVVPGDAPLLRTETLRALIKKHVDGNAAATILSAVLTNPVGYGRIVRKTDGKVAGIVEEKACDDELRAIQEVNSSTYCFTLEKLWPCLAKLRPNNVHRELYLTDVIALLNQQGETVLAEIAPDAREIFGCNTRAELAEVDRVFRARKATALMDAGVSMQMPETILIDPEVEIGPDTTIEACVHLLGRTRIGSGCTVRAGSILRDAVLEDGAVVEAHSILDSARLGRGAHAGPFARLRPGADIRAGAHVGNFVEVKKSVLGEGSKAMHLTYLGDARVGRNANIGAGTITCNYDGVKKNVTTIGNRVFIGSDTALVAPVRVGDAAYVAAGSTITENVPPGALGLARGRQVNKPGWVAARRREAAAAAKSKRPRRKVARPKRRRR